ncbi:MAG: TetR/AcrR family transcriptional regulator [Candidatus Brocadiaceae bacterium]|jgi:AcrR family transcriptional regulator
MPELSRKERERARHRETILEAAEAEFAEKGLHGATVQEIADRAEFSVGYLYNLFEGKESLMRELVDLRVGQFIAEMEARIGSKDDPLSKVRAAISGKMEFFRRHQRFFLIFSILAAEGRSRMPVSLSAKWKRRYQAYIEKLAATIAEGTEGGIFVEEDPMALAICLEGITNATVGYWVHLGGREPEPAAPETIQRVFLSGILRRSEER